MAYSRLKETKDGRQFYEIAVSRGRGKSRVTRRWYVPDGWSKKVVARQLAKESAEFERQVKAGEYLTRKEKAARAAAEAAERARILTVRQFTERVFLPSKLPTLSENTRLSYQQLLRNWIYPALEDFPLPDVTPAMVSGLLLSMQQQGKASATCNMVHNLIHQIFTMAVDMDAVAVNPVDRVRKVAKSKEERGKGPEALTVEQLGQVFQALEAEPLFWRVYVHVLVDTGCRRGEAAGLQWNDIDLKSGAVTISRSLNYSEEKGVYFSTPKSGKSRVVYVGAETLALLQQRRADQAASCVSKWVFSKQASPEPMNPSSISQYMKNLSGRCGIPLHAHLFRHSYATVAIQAGASVIDVQKSLGHSNSSTTLNTYSHGDGKSAERAANIFRKAIGEK